MTLDVKLLDLGKRFEDGCPWILLQPVDPPCLSVHPVRLDSVFYGRIAYPSGTHLYQNFRDVGGGDFVLYQKAQHQFVIRRRTEGQIKFSIFLV